MNTANEIEKYFSGLPAAKQTDMRALHQRTLQELPGTKLRYYDGKDSEGKIVANPTIGYGSMINRAANGKDQEWFQVGISANSTGISVYILGIKDKAYLADTFGKEIGKASVTGYCIKFKKLADIDIDVLQAAIRSGVKLTSEQ